MSGIVAMLLMVLALLMVLTVRQLLTLRVHTRRSGGLAEGWAALQAQNANELSTALLRIPQVQRRERAVVAVLAEQEVPHV
jgi:hypothetical protein